MADDDSQDKSSKTEEATPRKLEDARKKGQVVQSREIGHFFMMLALTVIIALLAPSIMRDFMTLMRPFIAAPEALPASGVGLIDLTRSTLISILMLMIVPIVILISAALTPAILQNKFFFAVERIKPKLEKISPIKGLGRLFGLKAFVEFIKSFLKISIVATIAYLIVAPNFSDFVIANNMKTTSALDVFHGHLIRLLMSMTFFLLLISFFDYFYQRFEFMKNLKMSKQEVKDEYKQQEGDPQLKMKRKQIARERSQKRMMSNVPDADVVITNPTHYAIALKYDQGTMQAPSVVAKGADKVAKRIRELAEANKVPIMRNPIIARALFDTAEIDEEIPYQHYEAVAKIISYVYKLKGKQLKPSTPELDVTKNKPKNRK
jgi:flagellar biosynthetic protein FlhB